jgi:hypothetical protein
LLCLLLAWGSLFCWSGPFLARCMVFLRWQCLAGELTRGALPGSRHTFPRPCESAPAYEHRRKPRPAPPHRCRRSPDACTVADNASRIRDGSANTSCDCTPGSSLSAIRSRSGRACLSCAQALRPSAEERGLPLCTYQLEYRRVLCVQPPRTHCCEHGAPQSVRGRRASGCLHMMKDIRKGLKQWINTTVRLSSRAGNTHTFRRVKKGLG